MTDYKILQSNTRATRAYGGENIRVYGCWVCRRTDVPLKKLGKDQSGLVLYGCPAHEKRPC